MLYEKFQYNISKLIGSFPLSKIAIAVSGGSDSVALLHLASIWTKKNNITLYVISVDHNLRPQSKLENQYIKYLSNNLGHLHYKLSFDHQNNFSNLQERAREGRYKLMTDLCQKLDILSLLTAHHKDDYIENFCLRLERKSGVFGLSSSNINWYNNTQIARPLHNIPKSDLVDYLTANNIKWFEDESNLSDKYRRNVIRKKLAVKEEYIEDNISLEQAKINKLVEDKFKPELICAIAESVQFFKYGFAYLDLTRFSTFSEEVKIQLINFLLMIISGKYRSARFYSVKPILNLILTNTNFKNTLHGCIIQRIQNNLLIYREFGKIFPENKILQGKPVIWDNRFLITPPLNSSAESYIITSLKLEDYKLVKNDSGLKELKDSTNGRHIAILFTLPVIKILEKVIAIPHISYYDNEGKRFKISFNSNFMSRFTHFC